MNVCMGFCFYNNVALAARAARARGLDRVLIVDWDVHHGERCVWWLAYKCGRVCSLLWRD